jgi:AraC family transcriptional regulator of adaptative response/methylated-DNA-[protein]-cysteine methyltransferase
MIAIADEQQLYLLEFVDCKGLSKEIERLERNTSASIVQGKNPPIVSIEKELELYFAGKLKKFETPIKIMGTPFRQDVWRSLQAIGYGETISYKQLAEAIGNPKACRAVANANGANQLAIIIPCHRVINSDGKLGGYGGGINRKQLLLDLEKAACNE